MSGPRSLTRAIEVTLIPYGDRMALPEGTQVSLTQALGGSFTAVTERGFLVRIEGADADAIGETLPAPPPAEEQAGQATEQLVWDQLRTCYDPEIPINIVELGLVYVCEVNDRPEGGKKARIEFTLTSPACPLGDVLLDDIRRKVLSVPEVTEVDAQVVFTPPWSSAMMSDAARLELGLM